MKTQILRLLIISFGLFALQGCMPEDAPIPKRIQIKLNVENVGTAVEREGNTVNVQEVKMLMDQFILDTDVEARIQANRPAILRYAESNAGSDISVFAGQIGFQYDTFTAIEIFIQQPDPQDNIPDRDLITAEDRYSIFIEGTYNGEEFVYRSKTSFTKLMDFDSISINGEEETLAILLRSDVQSFLIDPETGQILDPREESNSETIDALIEESFSVEASAEQSLPLN